MTRAAAMLGLLVTSCAEEAKCPASWNAPEGSCRPPERYTAEVRDRIGTGAYGYALTCTAPSDDDTCSCEELGLTAGDAFTFTELGDDGLRVDSVAATVADDGTFEVPLRPGVPYQVNVSSARTSDGVELFETSFTLEEGELLFMSLITDPC